MSQATRPVERASAPTAQNGSQAAPARSKAYTPRPTGTWWLRNRRYVLYMVRELTSIPIAAWVVVYLFQILRLQSGSGYQPFGGPVWIVFSVICLAFALLHTVTFLSLAGRIMRVPLGEGWVPPRAVVTAMFGLFVIVSVIIGFLMAFGGR
ncbi:MAG: hypothetical protein J2P45_12740 [Candidatus Dormibacteraeota bacterium]|nr:hypothetical protein [Candidatus Dormibacteraeota bacterium]